MPDPSAFIEGLISLRETTGHYQTNMDLVEFRADTLFDTSVTLPADLTDGNYETRIFLTRDRRVVARADATIFVGKVGLQKFLFSLAHEQPLIYGLMSLAIACACGWSASAAFRYFTS